MYDKGVISSKLGSFTPREQEDELKRQSKFYKSRDKVHKTPMTGRTAIYDFDAWSKSHYGETFIRREKAKARWTKEQEYSAMKNDAKDMSYLAKFILIAVVVYTCYSMTDYDTVPEKSRTSK
ncbi:uncharacterized protein LOC136025733 [Artemia franciscana]